ncbi:hypothetical protein K493DRAFT_70164 [Basidiobolus meristosporus CBS 931.73]|uniref:Uncharacterized protein n=1 Tax=Basidiobolus meristosporus CBS 931.73 TaxID=1314790 RepID=A0A1Y1XU38_9FUNG|nr:hypothetical protein K493DRAFT_70164 [Basidiobolus meristosporus CBS 931.73]|eukprot:ORX89269.1 hypothetical protein K493DRAFT_70164 [Basidiobolus meristosporus CBS 931.73]
MIPTLRILDGERFDAKFIERKEKKKLREEQLKKEQEQGQDEDEDQNKDQEQGQESQTGANPKKAFGHKAPGKKFQKRPRNPNEPHAGQPFKKRKPGNHPASQQEGRRQPFKQSRGKFRKQTTN